MYLYELWFFPDFYVCAMTRLKGSQVLLVYCNFLSRLDHTSHSVQWFRFWSQSFGIKGNASSNEKHGILLGIYYSPQGLLQELLFGHAGTALGWPLSTGFESASVVVLPNTVPRGDWTFVTLLPHHVTLWPATSQYSFLELHPMDFEGLYLFQRSFIVLPITSGCQIYDMFARSLGSGG